MPEQDFELYLSLLGKLLKLDAVQTAAVRDELRDHLEARLEELAATGLDRPRAIRQALDEFGDAAVLAEEFSRLARERRRRRLLRWTLAGSVTATAALLLLFAFWPIAPEAPRGVIAQADDSAAPAAAPTAAAPPQSLVNVMPVGIDPVNFVPEPLRLEVGAQAIETTLAELPKVLHEQFGATVILDTTRLVELGVDTEQTCRLPSGRPLYQSLDRALEELDLAWFWDRGVLHITTGEFANQRLVSVQYVVSNLLQRMSAGELIAAIEAAAGNEDYGPWLNEHGSGGTMVLLEDVLSVRQTQFVHVQVAALLAALADTRPDIGSMRSERELALQRALQELEVAGRLPEQTLQEAIMNLSESTELPFGVDTLRLTQLGVGLDTPVALDVPPRSLGQILELLLEPLGLTVIVRHGEIVVTTTEYSNQLPQTAVFDVSDIDPHGQRLERLIDAFTNQTGNEDTGPWYDLHGYGGTIRVAGKGRLVVRQTDYVLDEIRALLRDIRQAAANRPATPPKDPQAIETRYYRLPANLAEGLLTSIPRQVAVGTWNEPVSEMTDRTRGTMTVVSVGTFWKQLGGYGGLGGGGFGGGIGGGLGGGGGGFFQFGGTLVPGQPADGNVQTGGGGPLVATPPDHFEHFDAVLIVRHRVEVHEQLTAWLNQLLFDGPSGGPFGASVPTGVLPEQPREKVPGQTK